VSKTVTIGDKAFAVRGLTRREVKEFRSNGVNFGNLNALGDEKREEVADQIFKLAGVDVDAVDQLVYRDAQKVFLAIMEETFLTPDQEKNSASPAAS
jgi:hypothetical protein